MSEDFLHEGVNFVAVSLQRLLNHAPSAIGDHGTLEGGVSLKADNHIVIVANVSCGVSVNTTGSLRVDIVDALFTLLREHARQRLPHTFGTLCRSGKERSIPFKRRVVKLNEAAHVDKVLPQTRREPPPGFLGSG